MNDWMTEWGNIIVSASFASLLYTVLPLYKQEGWLYLRWFLDWGIYGKFSLTVRNLVFHFCHFILNVSLQVINRVWIKIEVDKLMAVEVGNIRCLFVCLFASNTYFSRRLQLYTLHYEWCFTHTHISILHCRWWRKKRSREVKHCKARRRS